MLSHGGRVDERMRSRPMTKKHLLFELILNTRNLSGNPLFLRS